MAAPKGEETALGSARGRFIESLPRKAIELRGAIALLTATPAAEGPREDMRRRLHTLYASALVFRNDELATAVKEGLERLDAARDQHRSLTPDDLDTMTQLVKRLPELRTGVPVPISGVPSARPSSNPSGSTGTVFASRPPPPYAYVTAAQPGPGSPHTGSTTALNKSGAELGAAGAQQAPLLQMVVHVLALSGPQELAEYGSLLPQGSVELTLTETVEQAVAAARQRAPDVVLADCELALQGDLIKKLRSDPLTDFVPVVLVQSRADAIGALTARDAGADDVLVRPLDLESLTRSVGLVTGTLVEEGTGLTRLGDATLQEVAERVAEEIRRGIVDTAELGRELKIPLGEGAEVLAAAWAAVARVRAFVAQQSGGRVRFAERPRRGGPALLALVGDGIAQEPLALPGTLRGRRVLVVDDDPSVVWFFAGLLREEGALVIEATDGREALQAARAARPDVVISDILMPHLDGFALCREFKRDPALAEVPVILISWKEDLLHRMRELSAGASGYLRKEVGAAQILERLGEVLRPRVQLEAQLKAGGEVRGSLEGTGIVPLLRSVRRERGQARVTVRDAWNLFECEIRDGRIGQLTRTASDGSFSRGEPALAQLLGANAGRFVVADSTAPVRSMLEGSLDEALHRGARSLGALIDAVSGSSLMKAERIGFDEDAYPVVLRQSPGPVRNIVERLHAGETPRLLLATGVSTQNLESILMDLARRSAIKEVRGKGGEDLVARALKLREGERPTQLATPFSIIPSAPTPVISVRSDSAQDRADRQLPSVLDPWSSFAAPAQGAAGAAAPAVSADQAARATAGSPSGHVAAPPNSPLSVAHAAGNDAPNGEFNPLSQRYAEPVLQTARRASEPPDPTDDARVADPLADCSLDLREASTPDAAKLAGHEDQATELPSAAAQVSDPARQRATEAAQAEAADLDSPARDDGRSRSTIVGWALALAALLAFGFYAERASENEQADRSPAQPGESEPGPSPEPAAEARGVEPAAAPDGPHPDGLPRSSGLVAPQDTGFTLHDGIVDPSVVVGPEQGLLIVEASVSAAESTLAVDGRRVGSLPAKAALSSGMHELSITNGDRVSYRYISVQPGKTWVLHER